MNSPTPHFLLALGLDDSADERAIRKAYAQRLKRIDQATEAQAFQDLREAYEVALRWAAWRRQQVAEAALAEEAEGAATGGAGAEPDVGATAAPASAPTPAAPDTPVLTVAEDPSAEPLQAAPEAEAPPTAEALAEGVFRAFEVRRDRVFDSEESARAALDAALADDRLVNLEARAIVEWRIARELFEGWQPGHEFLFGPACQVFHWEQERRRLGIYGRVGEAIDNAIEEKLLFFLQDPLEFNQQRSLVQRLRRDEVPPAKELMEAMPRLQVMAQRFPHWLRIVTSQAHYARWVEAYEAIPPQLAQAAQRRQAKAEARRSQPPWHVRWRQTAGTVPRWAMVLAIFLAIKAGSVLLSDPAPPRASASQRAEPTDLGRRQREAEAELKRVLAEARRSRAAATSAAASRAGS
ncbi:MAG: J domain-containing protein [Pseudomonadota bacterium]